MTVSTTTTKDSYSGNGSTTAFAYTFPINSTSEITVIERSSAGVETVKAEGVGSTNYSIADSGAAGGTVTMVTAPASGTTLVILRNTNLTQATDLVANDPFPAETNESAFDKIQMQTQEIQEEVDRSIKLSRTNTMTSTDFTNSAADRASKVLAFDSSGEISVTQELGNATGNWAASTAYALRDIVKDTDNNNIYICITAHTSSGTVPLSSNTDAAKWRLLVDAASATTSATAAASSATTATAQAVIATAKAVLTAADVVTTNADVVLTAADVVSAEAAKTSAETAYDNFDDRYLGAKSSAPTVDNDGNALLTGALYFNSSSDIMFNWTSADAWEAVKPSSAEQTKINALGASAVITDMSILATSDIVTDMSILATSDIVTDMSILATSDIVTDMSILATADIVEDMSILATSDIVTDMSILATSDIVTDMSILATSDIVTDMSILGTADVVEDMSILGTADIVEDMSILGTAAVVEDMSILGTAAIVEDLSILGTAAIVEDLSILGTSANVTAMATVSTNIAGVTSFADRYRVGSSDPVSSLDEGDLAYNTTSNALKYYDGSSWNAITSDTDVKTLVSANDTTAGYLNGKLVAGSNVTFTENNDGSDETLTIAATDNSVVMAIALGA